MRTLILLVAIAGLTVPDADLNAADIYRCATPDGLTYQDHICPQAGARLPHDTTPVATPEARAAQIRSRRQEKLVQTYEKEREALRRAADRDRLQQAAERAGRAKRCERYTRTITRIEDELSAGSSRRKRARELEREVREARERHFSECVGAP